MRTTLDIDEDVLLATKAIAQRERVSAGQVVSRLLRQAMTQGSSPDLSVKDAAAHYGFRPFAARGVLVTDEQVSDLREREGI